MKNLIILIISLTASTLYSQFKKHSFSFSYDQGPGIAFVRDYSTTFQRQFEIVGRKNLGTSIGYSFFHRLYRGGALSFGLDLSFMSFSHNVTFTNLPKGLNQNPETYEIGSFRNYYINIDLPFKYYYSISVNEKNFISPYIGLKIRSIAYIRYEERNSSLSGGTGFIDENGIKVFDMKYDLEYGAYSSRLAFNPILGIEYTKILKKGNSLTFFTSYNFGLLNSVEFKFVDLDIEENGVSYTELEEKGQRFRVRMSHFRVGLAFRWEKVKEEVVS